MPALTIASRLQKQESRPEAAFDSQKRDAFVQRFENCLRRLALCKPTFFRSTSRASRVTSPAVLRAGLSAFPASVHVHHDVEARQALGELERLAHYHAAGLAREEFVHRLAVDDELSLAGLQKNAGHRALAPPGAVVIVADHSCS